MGAVLESWLIPAQRYNLGLNISIQWSNAFFHDRCKTSDQKKQKIEKKTFSISLRLFMTYKNNLSRKKKNWKKFTISFRSKDCWGL
jgi:hypothetical protein